MPPTQFQPPTSAHAALKDKVVVLTGGAQGIGAEIVRLLHQAGANVFFGDVLEENGRALVEELTSSSPSLTNRLQFVKCDVTSYQENLVLFDAALSTCGRIDHAIANAGIGEQGKVFDPALTMDSVREEPRKAISVVDVNLKGEIYFARIASVYLRQSSSTSTDGDVGADRSLTLVGSVASFREDPGLFVYIASKHGVLGLMRSLRNTLIKFRPSPIRTNAICPWMTRTRLVAGVEQAWAEAGLPHNDPVDVARIVVGTLADRDLNGAALYIEGARAWNVEEGLSRTRADWLGERQGNDLDRGTVLMGGGDHWTDNKSSQV